MLIPSDLLSNVFLYVLSKKMDGLTKTTNHHRAHQIDCKYVYFPFQNDVISCRMMSLRNCLYLDEFYKRLRGKCYEGTVDFPHSI